MAILKFCYKIFHPGVPDDKIPKQFKMSIWKGIMKPVRKYFSAVIIPTIPFNGMRVCLYRLFGYNIGKGTFIGMRCYLDDVCYDKIEIGKNVTISYGVYFACHGRKQRDHNKIIIKNGAYIGMRASIISPHDVVIGEGSIVGACALVNKNVPDYSIAVGVPCRILDKKVPARKNRE